MTNLRIVVLAALSASGIATLTLADVVQIRVTVENLAPVNSISFAPLRIGFHNGTYDPFNAGEVATAPIISIAEGGSGSAFFPAFAMAQADATLGTVLPNPPGPLVPGLQGQADFAVDSAINSFFTFGSMVVPSNDYFIGNDSPTQYMVFDANGNFVPTTILQRGSDIWDAGSELDGIFGAAFLMGSSNDDHIDQNGVVIFDFEGLTVFNGATTAVGYTFASQLTARTDVYRITLSLTPACDADLDSNGEVGATDLGVLLGAWGGTGAGDLDGDGSVGASDLGVLLGAWGGCS
ncbi:MAG: spondin domain-containing protein [Phycisphaerae bacterium]|nr:spondin domain-containing protein [Phycisphaerae bacterium]